MALKVLVLNRNIKAKEKELADLLAQAPALEERKNSLTADIEAAVTEEDRLAVEEAVKAYDADEQAHFEAKAALEGEIQTMRNELAELERNDPPAPKTGAEHVNERIDTTMIHNINVRELPLGQRVFDALPMAKRQEIVAQDDVKTFLAQLRSFKGVQTAVSGADLLIPTVLLDLIAENRYRYSKLLNRVRVRQLRGNGKQPVAGLIPPAVWTGACKRLNEVQLVFNEVVLDDYKNAAIVVVCNADLEDSDIGLAAFIVEAISESLGLSDDMAILYGKGAAYNMPLGVVTRLSQAARPSDYPVNAPEWVDLHTSNVIQIDGSLTGAAFWAQLRLATGNTFTRYSRGELSWAMNSKTYAMLESKAIATTLTGEWVAMIGGRLPIVSGNIDVLEFMADGDIVGGYFDLYLWGQRRGVTIGMDDMGFTNRVNDQTVFFGKERADGLPVIPGAFVAININGQAPASAILFPTDDANTLVGLVLPAAATLTAGETLPLRALALPVGIEAAVTYTSGTPAKATVDANGVVTGVAAGSSVITATAGGYTATCTVTVTAAS